MTTTERMVALDDRYTAEDGRILISGIQALVRLTLEQRRMDAGRGHNTGVFVSGYPGSPLGGVDRELHRMSSLLAPAGVSWRPGLNEELAATAVNGTQLLGQLPGRRHDGVVGFWYGKNPGLDRAADAIRHGNLTGTAPLGGAVAWIGDDPASKSSTVPSSCEPMCRSLMVPLLAPGTVAEILDFGLHAVALSRHAGTWAGLKIVADIADASAVVDLDGLGVRIPDLPARDLVAPPTLLPPDNLDAEVDLMTDRLQRVFDYERLATLNRVTCESARARLAVIAAGTGYQAVLRALDQLGVGPAEQEAMGLRLVQLGMPWPLETGRLRALLRNVETVLVVEDKLAFVESRIKEALYRQPAAPRVLGKEAADGSPLLTPRAALDADAVAAAIVSAAPEGTVPASVMDRLRVTRSRRSSVTLQVLPSRTPYFCSGCPHNISTKAQPDQLVGVGIGCHVMVAVNDEQRGRLMGMTQMGGEGAQWLGLEPFTDDRHFTQNIGDGTFHHSGSLALRAAVAAGTRITYRLLYNDAVAMTGGQQAVGKLDVPRLTAWLALEGVRRVVVTTPEPETYRGVGLDAVATVRHRDELPAIQAELSEIDGVTVILHDDRCATEKRRMRKRGQLPPAEQKVWINERVCEGCGDCGQASTCLSVQPVDTDFGRKTRIHQSSCNQDLSCLKGNCPSFLLITSTPGSASKTGAQRMPIPTPPIALPEPVVQVPRDVLVRMPGIGGTGVVTISAIVQMAAHLDGRWAAGLEQVGLAQKGGPVVSDVRIADAPVTGQLRAASGSVDVVLGFDVLGTCAPETLAVMDPTRTAVVVDSAQVPTAQMVLDPSAFFPSQATTDRRLAAAAKQVVTVDAGWIAERLFADHMPANLVLLGAAVQLGMLPLTARVIEKAITLNGAAVQTSLAAFRWGRASVVDPTAVRAALTPAVPPPIDLADPDLRQLTDALIVDDALRLTIERRAAELRLFQDQRCARRYIAAVADVARIEADRNVGEGLRVTDAFARNLHKLMAYKDEYEVARLHLDAAERTRLESELGPDVRVQVLLDPPILRAFGRKEKLRLGRGAFPLFRGLAAMRRLRGTPLDVFGYSDIRRIERALPNEYVVAVHQALAHLDLTTVDLVIDVAASPDLVRGYEDVKMANVARYRAQIARLLEEMEGLPAQRDLARVATAGGGQRDITG